MPSSGSDNLITYSPRILIGTLAKQAFFLLGLLFFLLMLVIPTAYQEERAVLLLVLTFGCLIYALHCRWSLHKTIFLWGVFTVAASIAFMALGAINSAPGALRVGTVYVLWPILFLFFMGMLSEAKQLHAFMNVIVIGAIAVALMAMMLVADYLFNLGLGMSDLLEAQGAILSISDGVIEYQLFNMTTAIYALPFLLGGLLMPRIWSPFKGRWRTVAWLALALVVITLLISGRRAFWLTAAMSPLIVWGLLRISGMQTNIGGSTIKGVGVGVVTLIVTIPLFDIELLRILEDFRSGFDFSDANNISAYYRREQFYALLSGWTESPLLGAGLGASASGSIRNEGQPWAYEMTYLALLYQTGMAGILIYGAAVAWIFFNGVLIMRRIPESSGFLVPTLSALACFLLANATNPYLQKFDYLWTLFLPIAVLNFHMLRLGR